MKSKIKVDVNLSKLDLENLENAIAYSGLKITEVKFDEKNKEICFEINDSAVNSKNVITELSHIISKITPMGDAQPIEVLFDNLKEGPVFTGDVFSELINTGDVFQHLPGIFSFSGKFLKMMNVLEKKVIELAKTQGAEEVSLPVTTGLGDLQKSDFFKRTPQFAQFISLMPDSSKDISDFSKNIKNGKIAEEMKPLLRAPEHMCRSAVCLSSYPRYAEKVLDKKDFFCITSMGKNFRNESSNVTTLERLYEFSMREIIYFGDTDYVSDQLNQVIDWFKSFLTDFKLKGIIQAANDPFFLDNLKALQFYQLNLKTKYEVRLVNPSSKKEVSCGSINNHGPHFSKAFNIKLSNGEYATTGCVGFGLERLVFLVLSQFGPSLNKWPAKLRTYFEF